MLTDDVFASAYNVVIPGFGNTHVETQPSYPFKADRFELPEGCENVSVTITSSSYRDKYVTLAPARRILADNESYIFTKENIKSINSTEISSANNIIVYNKVVEKAGKKLVEVGLKPVQYDSTNGVMRVYYNFSYQINYLDTSGNPIQINPIEKIISKPILKQSYLILSKPEFSEICQSFASQKKLLGYTCNVVLSENWTPTEVKQTIMDYRNNSIEDLRFVLLVGSNDIVPSNIIDKPVVNGKTYTILSDYSYSCLDSEDDFEQDVYIGRIPAYNVAEAEVAINKIKNYEWNPIEDEDFYNNSLHCSHYEAGIISYIEERKFIWTTEKIYDALYNDGYDIARVYTKSDNSSPQYYKDLYTNQQEILPASILDPGFNWHGTNQDVINNINRGVFYVLHRDHGKPEGWEHPSFTISDINSLNNGAKLPVVFSLNCSSGYFYENCFASKLLTKENGGSVGIYAASYISFSPYNDYLTIGMFNSIWRNSSLATYFQNQPGMSNRKPVYSLGEILDEGMQHVCSRYSSNDLLFKYTRERIHIFGDPGMMIHTQQPVYYNKHSVLYNKTSPLSVKLDISLNNDQDDVYLAISDSNTAELYTGKNITFSGYASPTTRIYIYGPNYKPTYVMTGVETYPLSDNTTFGLYVINKNVFLTRENFIFPRAQTVNVYDTNMNLVKTVEWPANESTAEIDLSTLNSGIYIVSILQNGTVKKSWNVKI